jgi:hypothetical protein
MTTQAHSASVDDNICNILTHSPRATRFSIQTPVLFRKRGQTEWQQGTTLNISRTGVLFHSKIDLPSKAHIEMQIILPHGIAEEAHNILCWGPIIRMDASFTKKCGQPALAAAISHYRFGDD